MTHMEVAFQRLAYEELVRENENMGGIFFPFLTTKRLQVNRILQAGLTATKKPPHYVCFGAYRDLETFRYNGVWFSAFEPELEAEGLVEVVYYRVKALISFSTNVDETEAVIFCKPSHEALVKFFNFYDALHISNKAQLLGDDELPF